MGYKLRFVQQFRQKFASEYLELEKQFAALEQHSPEFPKGKRYLPYIGGEASNTLIWECEFDTLEETQQALAFLHADTRHEALFQQQAKYIVGTRTEILKPYDA